MAADFKAVSRFETKKATIGSATVIEAGDLVALSSGVVIKAVAASTEIAFAPQGSASGETEIEISMGRVELVGTADAAFAVTDKGIECDLVGTTTLLIDLGESTTDVFKVSAADNAGTATSTDNVRVFINKPIIFDS